MEIHLLKVSLTDNDLNELVRQHVPRDLPVEDLRVDVTAQGVAVRGMYPLFVNVNFETLWDLSVQDGLISAQLVYLKALGVPANIFKSAILKLVENATRHDASLRLAGDVVLVDLERLLIKQGLTVRPYLRAITCQAGILVVEAGSTA